MQLNLNIYKKGKVEKVYTANEFDIMFGTAEDLIDLMDLDKLSGKVNDADMLCAVAALLKGGIEQVKTLMLEIFPEATEDELKRTKIKEVAAVLIQVLKHSISEIAGAGSPN